MARSSKQPSRSLVLTAPWQWAFSLIMVASLLAEVIDIVRLYTSHGYIGAGTWTYHISTWAYPLLSAAAGLAFAYRRSGLWLHRLFWAVFLATLSTTVMNIVMLVENQVRAANGWFYTGNSASYWLAFGWDWVTMGVCFALYCGGLVWIGRRRHS